MSEQAQSVKSYNNKKGFWKKLKLDFKNHWQIYLMAVPVILYFAIFNYAPMVGIIMAFQKYQIRKGIFGSQFVGMTNFMRFFSGPYFWRTLRNTLLISLYGLLLSFPLPIVFALCLNEVRNTRFKKIVQTISYLPYFISVVVVVSILFDFGKSNGILTQLALYSINLRIQGIGTDLGSRANVPMSINKYKNMLVSLRNVGNFSLDNPIWLLLLITVLLIGVMYWFFGTEYGCGLRAVGANQQMARAQGINTNTGKVIGLMISNGLVAFSGALMAQYQGFSDVSMGRGAIVIGLAAVIIGEVIFGKKFRNFALKLLAVSLGAIIYYLVIQVVLWMGLSTDDLKLLTALVVALFLAMPYWKSRLSARKLKGGAGNG